jgi:hypothetical protein
MDSSPQPNLNGVRDRERPRRRLAGRPGRRRSRSKAKSPSTAAKDKAVASRSKAPAAKGEDPAAEAPGTRTTPRPKPSDATPAFAATSPDLAAVKEAIALVRKGELAQTSDVQKRIGDPVAAKRSSGRSYAATAARSTFDAMLPSSPTIRVGRASVCCAGARRPLSGRNASIPQTVRAYFGKDQPLTAMGSAA